ncbi:hypothetical protein [Arenivirga flava]|uniref:Uncharacterized protein n=1 Tax=Arenivirga flava TaxID=1930060 RepID=A0AA37XBB0_9MICO|nr:hypothetical protein [Arenivirga flava]GMA27407.1 hypothetical protein GCM10025874_06600 [Arenivirga flava]
MNFFLDLMSNTALWGGFIAIAGSALVWLTFTFPSYPRERAWYLERGEGRWFSRPGHARGFSLLRASRPADHQAIDEFERMAVQAERARSWASIATIPFLLIGLIALASAVVLVNVSSLEGLDIVPGCCRSC